MIVSKRREGQELRAGRVGFLLTGLLYADAITTVSPTYAREIQTPEQGVRLAYVDVGNAKIELMEPSRPDSPVAKFLERNPKGGIHHFSLSVESALAQNECAMSGKQVLTGRVTAGPIEPAGRAY